jgi:Peptidase family M28
MKRSLAVILFAMSLIAAMAGSVRADDGADEGEGNARPKLDGEIKELIRRIDPARIQNNIEKLATFGTRNSCSTSLAPDPGRNNGTQGILASQDFIFAQFASNKRLRVAFAPFFHANCPTSPTQNVVAWLPGMTHPERLVVIGGHLDSRSFNVLDTNPDTSALLAAAGVPPGGARATENAPAGNDAGAQTTVVLEAASALARAQFDNTIVFISFSGEEQGLFGSADVAVPGRLAAITGIPNATVIAMLNNDISGGDNLANTGDDFSAFRLYSAGTPRERTSAAEDGTTDNTSPNRGLMRFIATFGVPFVPGFEMRPILREDRPGRASDQASFIANRVPAVRFIESHECSSSPVDNSCPAVGDPLVAGRPCPSPFAALPRTDLRHNCLHTNFNATGAAKARICDNDDERAHGIVLDLQQFGPQKFLNEGCVDPTNPNPFHNFQRQHAPNDRPEFPTADYEAKIAHVMTATLASLARAPNAPVNFVASGDATNGVTVTFSAAPGDEVEKFIVAARATTENFYRARVGVEGTRAFVTPQQLKMAPGQSFFISVSARGDGGHESLFAYPEFRCDASRCAIPDGALNITASK